MSGGDSQSHIFTSLQATRSLSHTNKNTEGRDVTRFTPPGRQIQTQPTAGFICTANRTRRRSVPCSGASGRLFKNETREGRGGSGTWRLLLFSKLLITAPLRSHKVKLGQDAATLPLPIWLRRSPGCLGERRHIKARSGASEQKKKDGRRETGRC